MNRVDQECVQNCGQKPDENRLLVNIRSDGILKLILKTERERAREGWGIV
jgi:hypothetical protein